MLWALRPTEYHERGRRHSSSQHRPPFPGHKRPWPCKDLLQQRRSQPKWLFHRRRLLAGQELQPVRGTDRTCEAISRALTTWRWRLRARRQPGPGAGDRRNAARYQERDHVIIFVSSIFSLPLGLYRGYPPCGPRKSNFHNRKESKIKQVLGHLFSRFRSPVFPLFSLQFSKLYFVFFRSLLVKTSFHFFSIRNKDF